MSPSMKVTFAHARRPRPRRGEHGRIIVDADDRPLRADECGDEQRHVARPTAHVEHPHARPDARFLE